MTATGWTFEELNASQASDVMALLGYWIDEPPAHVLLAGIARFLGVGPAARQRVDESQARQQMGELGAMLGQQARPLPAHLRAMVQSAEALKSCRKGLRR